MKTRFLVILSLVLWFGTFSVAGWYFMNGTTSKSKDGRISVHLTATEKDYVLNEMRGLIKGVNHIFVALGKGDQGEVAKVASSLGMVLATDDSPQLLLKLPVQLKTLGLGLHQSFDDLAKDIRSGLTQKETLVRLGQMTEACVACHSIYRLDVVE